MITEETRLRMPQKSLFACRIAVRGRVWGQMAPRLWGFVSPVFGLLLMGC